MQYEITRTIFGKYVVHYECPECGSALKSNLSEAGHRDTCPDCKTKFIVPGEDARRRMEINWRKKRTRKTSGSWKRHVGVDMSAKTAPKVEPAQTRASSGPPTKTARAPRAQNRYSIARIYLYLIEIVCWIWLIIGAGVFLINVLIAILRLMADPKTGPVTDTAVAIDLGMWVAFAISSLTSFFIGIFVPLGILTWCVTKHATLDTAIDTNITRQLAERTAHSG